MRKDILVLGAIALVVIVAAVVVSNSYRSSVANESVTSNTNTAAAKASSEALVRSDSWSMGPADAKVTIVEFYDPECESCAAFNPVVKKIMQEYKGRVRLVVRYMPLHPNSLTAATFTEGAGEQGKYWEAYDLLFQKQPEWGTKHGQPAGVQADVNTLFRKYATELGLDMAKMDAVFAGNRYAAKVERDKKDGQSLGVRQTPTIFVNGRKLLRLNEADFKALIDEELGN